MDRWTENRTTWWLCIFLTGLVIGGTASLVGIWVPLGAIGPLVAAAVCRLMRSGEEPVSLESSLWTCLFVGASGALLVAAGWGFVHQGEALEGVILMAPAIAANGASVGVFAGSVGNLLADHWSQRPDGEAR
jgi:hypothetical protein